MKNEKNYSVENIDTYREKLEKIFREIREWKIISRIWEKDFTVWKPQPAEIANRLGWLDSPQEMQEKLPQISDFVEEVRREGFTHVLLLGMGGSSLAPEMFRLTFGVKPGFLDLSVLDSTDPGAVSEYARRLDSAKTLYIVSTKSGGTVETLSFMKYFYNRALKDLGREKAGRHFVAVTDPGSGLEALAKELRFRQIFLNNPDIGGRYSALSFFGLVPAALIGVDLNLLLERAQRAAEFARLPQVKLFGKNPAACLGALMGELAKRGQDKLTFVLSPSIAAFGYWVEQLIAESTGKEGRGILPVDGEPLVDPQFYRADRQFVYLRLAGEGEQDSQIEALKSAGYTVHRIDLKDVYDLGGEFFRWEFATAIAGWRLGINPFDQPNVESAKIAARKMMEAYQKEGKLPELSPTLQTDGITVYADDTAGSLEEILQQFFARAKPGDEQGRGRSYIALQAYIKPAPETEVLLQELREKLLRKYRVATTVGYGPRFLHSTGQLHKGDAGNGLFVQIVSQPAEDVAIPDAPGEEKSSIGFGVLKLAQSLGDRDALLKAGRPVLRFQVKEDVNTAIAKITAAL